MKAEFVFMVLILLLALTTFYPLLGASSVSSGNGVFDTNHNFLDLNDTPNSYSGQANNLVAVNAGETGLSFVSPSVNSGDTNCSTSQDCNNLYVNITGDTLTGDLNTNDLNTHAIYPQLNNTYNIGTATNRYNFVLAQRLGSAGTLISSMNIRDINFIGRISGGDFNYGLSDANGSQSCSGNQFLTSVGATTSCGTPTGGGGNGTTYTSGTPATIQVNPDLNTISQNFDGNDAKNFKPWFDGNFQPAFDANFQKAFDANLAARMPIDDTNLSSLSWTKLQNYPTGCGAFLAIQTLNDTPTCISIPSEAGIDANALNTINGLDLNHSLNYPDTNCSTSVDCNNLYLNTNDGDNAKGLITFDGNIAIPDLNGIILGDTNARIWWDGNKLILDANAQGNGSLIDANNNALRVATINVYNSSYLGINGAIIDAGTGAETKLKQILNGQLVYTGSSAPNGATFGFDLNGTASNISPTGGTYFVRAQHITTTGTTMIGFQAECGFHLGGGIIYNHGVYTCAAFQPKFDGLFSGNTTLVPDARAVFWGFRQVAIPDLNGRGVSFGSVWNNDVQINQNQALIFDGPNDTNKGNTDLNYGSDTNSLILQIDGNNSAAFGTNKNVWNTPNIFQQDINALHDIDVGNTIRIDTKKSNACAGLSRLSSGTVTVSTTCVDSNSMIFLTKQGVQGTTPITAIAIGVITPQTSFTIVDSNAGGDRNVSWLIMKPVN